MIQLQLRRRTVALALTAFMVVAGMAAVSFVRTLDPAEAGGGFADTPPWVADEASWLAVNGIASGFPGNLFKPNDDITRGQAAFWFSNNNSAIELRETAVDPASSTMFIHTTECPLGKRAVAGGGYTLASGLFITDSHPKDNVDVNPTGWTVRWETTGGSIDPTFVRVWALCIPGALPNSP